MPGSSPDPLGPGLPSEAELAALDHAVLWHPFTPQRRWTGQPPLIIAEAEGCWLIDTAGRRYLDGVSSLWTTVHGHRHPVLDAALRQQLDRVAHSTLLGLSHPQAILLARELLAVAPTGLSRVFYSDSGSSAVEVALKMAFQAQRQRGQPDRVRFATLSDAYHGDTLGAVSVGAIELFHGLFGPLLFEPLVLPAPLSAGGSQEAACLQRALQLLDAQGASLAALVVEPLVQGAGGMKMHSPAFLRALLERARKHGALLIIDEVATGFGRTGTLFASEQIALSPDLLCVAKGLSGGYLPLAATLTSEAVYDAFLAAPEAQRQFFHGHTFTGNPLAAAVGRASLALLQASSLAEGCRLANDLTRLLGPVAEHPAVAAVRQRGVMVGIDLTHADGRPGTPAEALGHRVCMAARAHGVVIRPLGDTLVLNPPLVMSCAEAELLVGGCLRAIDEIC